MVRGCQRDAYECALEGCFDEAPGRTDDSALLYSITALLKTHDIRLYT